MKRDLSTWEPLHETGRFRYLLWTMGPVSPGERAESVADAVAERDFYRQLLELGFHPALEPFAEKALELMVAIAGARRGCIEFVAERAGAEPEIRILHAVPAEETDSFRAAISSGVVAEALATGKTIISASALTDPRFRERGSVRQNRIEAVLCAPIGTDRTLGVIYLQDRSEPGPFSEADRERVEIFARHLAPYAERLLLRRRDAERDDATRPFRAQLHAEGVIGRSRAMAKVLEQVRLVAPHRVSVLINGPTGTGKTQIARVIHENSPRASEPFVELNCAVLPGPLVENELFGAVAGAHSTATTARAGKVAAADGGTLFLDEVAELEPAAQSKLLQLLQSGEYFPLGSTQARRADIRVIAASNTDLREAIAKKAFREDLYYRLNVLPIRMPALAERKDDVAPLVLHFVAKASEANDLPALDVSLGALHAAESCEWPGNVRELANVVEAAVLRARAEDAAQIEARHLFPELDADAGESPAKTYEQHLRAFKKQLLLRALQETDWNVSETSRRLDLARSQVNHLIKALGLSRNVG